MIRSGPLPLLLESVRGCPNGSAREPTPSLEATVWCFAVTDIRSEPVARIESRPLLEKRRKKLCTSI
jgi:hypothetical protein